MEGSTWISWRRSKTLTSNTQAKREKTKEIHRTMKHVLSWWTTRSLLSPICARSSGWANISIRKSLLLIERDNKSRNVCWTTINVHSPSLSRSLLHLSSDSPTEGRSCEVIERFVSESYWHKHIRLYRLLVQIWLALFDGRAMSVHVCVWSNTGRFFATSRENLGSSRFSSFSIECRWFQIRSRPSCELSRGEQKSTHVKPPPLSPFNFIVQLLSHSR